MTIFMSKPIGKKKIFISKTSKTTRKHKQNFTLLFLFIICCVVSMKGDGKGRRKGTDTFYVLQKGKPLISGFGDCISRCSVSVPFIPGENSSPWTLMQNGNQLGTGKIVKENKSPNILIWLLVCIKEHGNGEYLFSQSHYYCYKLIWGHCGY